MYNNQSVFVACLITLTGQFKVWMAICIDILHAYRYTVQGKTPYDLAVSSQHKTCIEMISVEMKKRSPQGLWDTITRNTVSGACTNDIILYPSHPLAYSLVDDVLYAYNSIRCHGIIRCCVS